MANSLLRSPWRLRAPAETEAIALSTSPVAVDDVASLDDLNDLDGSYSESTPFAQPSPRPMIAERGIWTFFFLGLLSSGISVCGFWWTSPWTVALGALMTVAGTVGMAGVWLARDPLVPWVRRIAIGSVPASILFPQVFMIHTRSFYTTDAAAFDHLSARMLLNGKNPYSSSLAPAAKLLPESSRYWTYTVTGGHVVHASYPAGSFLLTLPAMALGLGHMTVDWVDLACWLASAMLLFFLVPRQMSWVVGLFAISPLFSGTFSSGGTDAMFLPFLMLAVWRWDRFASPSTRQSGWDRWLRWVGPVAMGLACSIKQTPWFFVPFIVVGIYLECRTAGRSALKPATAYAFAVALVFLAVNAPFIVWQPSDWLHGTLLPFTGGLIADGQGLVTIATHGLSGGANLGLLSDCALLSFLALLIAFATWYPAMKRVWPILVPAVFLLSPRSLSSYLIDLIPVAIVGAISVGGPVLPVRGDAQTIDLEATARRLQTAPMEPVRKRGLGTSAGKWALVGIFCAIGGVSFLAFTDHPLGIRVLSTSTQANGSQIATVAIRIHNSSDASLRPHFLVNPGSGNNAFWSVEGTSSPLLKPGTTQVLTLVAPDATTAPQHGAKWLVEAYTTNPNELSTSPLQTWQGSWNGY